MYFIKILKKMTDQNCESSTVKIVKLLLQFLDKHASIAKLLFIKIGQAILIFSMGAAFAVIYHFFKSYGIN